MFLFVLKLYSFGVCPAAPYTCALILLSLPNLQLISLGPQCFVLCAICLQNLIMGVTTQLWPTDLTSTSYVRPE